MLFVPNGAELFVGALKELGIDRIFTLVGDHLNEVLMQAKRHGISIIDMRHESGVTHAADAWARITRCPALALVTGGPGHTNAITGVATAQLAGSPLIAVSGSRASTMSERQAFQDIDQVAMMRPIVKWAAEPPSAALIPFYLGRAYTEANSGRKGAVHLTIPVDLFVGAAEIPARFPRPVPLPATGASQAQVDQAIALLNHAKRPVVIAGSGVWWSGAEESLREFIEAANLPLFTITMARGVVSDEHPQSMGYADPALNRAVRHAFPESDVCLVIGKRIDFRLGFGGRRVFSPEAKFIQIDIHPQEFGINREVDISICADAKMALQALTAGARARQWTTGPWLDRLRALRADAESQLASAGSESETPIHSATLFRALKRLLPRDTYFSWDGGDFAHWGRAILPAKVTGGWLRLGPLGTIGAALPNTVALKLAHPNSPVVMLTGDGALGFYIAELDTLVRHGLPVVIIVGNDGGWGLERELQSSETGADTVACELRRSRYDIVVQGFGGCGENIDRLEQLEPALARALDSSVPYLLNVNIAGARSPFTEWNISGRKK
jgi:acetolactate synthase-1/2/3 large subunit